MMEAVIHGLSMYYEDRGGGQPEPIVFLHGFPLDHSMWRHQLDFFAATHRCIAPDLRGHGRTTETGEPRQPGQVTIDMLADDVAALLDHLGVRRAAVCGLSMGGYVAFALWRRHPGRVGRMILVDTKAAADTEEAKAGRYKLAELVKVYGARAAADAMMPRLVAPGNLSRDAGLDIRKMIERASPGDIVTTLHALASRPDSTGLLAGLTVPCLVVVGAQDVITPLSDADVIYSGVAGDRKLAVIPDAGHMSPMENPELVNQALAGFLNA